MIGLIEREINDMINCIEDKTANEVWKKATKKLLKHGSVVNGRNGETLELLHTMLSIENPRQKWIYDRIPPISIGYSLAEMVWIMNGEEQSDIINFWNPNLSRYSGNEKIYYGAYGKRMRAHFKFDQLEKASNALQNVPESRQVVIQIYDTKKDFPIDDGKPRNSDIPCNICSMLKIREEKLEWTQIMRSNDILLGMPYDFIQFTSLQEILAGWIGIEVGTYTHYSDSLHLYCSDSSRIGMNNARQLINSDSLSLCKNESQKIFTEIYKRMISLMNNNISEKEIFSLAHLKSEYVAYNNIMLIIAAYVARKLHYSNLEQELVNLCKNELYIMMWNSWCGNKFKG